MNRCMLDDTPGKLSVFFRMTTSSVVVLPLRSFRKEQATQSMCRRDTAIAAIEDREGATCDGGT